jgi:Tfp pilus assembly protein FimV
LVQQYQKRVEAEKLAANAAQAPAPAPAQATKTPAAETTKSAPAPVAAKPAQSNQHVVQNNESLWAIAQRVATEQNRPIGEVMQQIKTENTHAFIQGDINRLRRGATLNLQTNTNKPQKQVVNPTTTTAKQSGKAKYRLNQAEMSLVAEKNPESTNGSAKQKAENEQISNELSLKVMTSREKTVKLQKDVTQLELALRHKDQRIQLLNARLAQLQQQLKAQQAQKKPNS